MTTQQEGIGFVSSRGFSLQGISMREAASRVGRTPTAFQKLADRIGLPYNEFKMREDLPGIRLYDPNRIGRFAQLIAANPPQIGSRWNPSPELLSRFDLP